MIEKLIESLPSKTPQERLTMRRNAEAWANGEDQKKAEQGRAFLEALDRFERQSADEERARLMNLPLVDRIVEAFHREPPTDTHVALIKVLAENPGSTSSRLSELIGWEGLTWQMHFGIMAKEREAFIEPAPPSQTRKNAAGDDEKFYCGLLCDYDRETSGFTLKPESLTAFQRLGFVSTDQQAK